MSFHSPQRIVAIFVFLVIIAACSAAYRQSKSEQSKISALADILAGPNGNPDLDLRIKSASCVIQDGLPDHECTPGAVFANLDLNQICTAGYTKTVRNVSLKTRKSVFAEYGISYPQPYGYYEVDHLIPLAIGGSNDIANLFPQPAKPFPGFREKDIVEIYLQEQVCLHNVSLSVAESRIAENWLEIYRNIPQEDIDRLKAKFKNWSN